MTPRLDDPALDAALGFLLATRDEDGLWRDFPLASGASWTWTTGWVGWSLTRLLEAEEAARLLRPTVQALDAARKPGGWGSSPRSAADADSTAWVLRLLAALKDPRAFELSELLLDFIAWDGGVRPAAGPQRYGLAAQDHGDVTPVAGLALAECGGNATALERLRGWVLQHRAPGGGWLSCRWNSDCYATSWSLAFLDASGGIPAPVRAAMPGWAARQPPAASALELALQLELMLTAGMPGTAGPARALLAQQAPDGSWPPSALMLMPDQRRGSVDIARPVADTRGLITTAFAAQALARWSRAEQGASAQRAMA
jgi:hypothetical protein